jgi:hypothetical protein
MGTMLGGVEKFIRDTLEVLNERLDGLENACKITAKSLAAQLTE